jgi:N-acetylmuramoyl-L-alanine amidase
MPVAARARSRLAWCAAVALLGSFCAYAGTFAAASDQPPTAFDHAEELRTALESQPLEERTRIEYQRVLNAYRAIYHGNPGASKADASINAVAELLTEEGRLFAEKKSLHDAAAQYEFLRQNYPYSHYRFSALIAEGEIYRKDIGDQEEATAKFEEFVKKYPRNALAVEARTELKELRDEEPPRTGPLLAEGTAKEAAPTAATRQTGGDEPSAHAIVTPDSTSFETPLPDAAPVNAALTDTAATHRSQLPRITGIRYWSTPSGTRIAIDLEDQVQYQTGHVPNPDRIYFDLRDARLAPALIGKSVAVAHDAFLKRIRAAQFSDDVTRIVLDVSPAADYSAFFLPNPWRLIIDVRARQATDSSTTSQASPSMPALGATDAGTAPIARKREIRNELASLDASLAALTVANSSQGPAGAGTQGSSAGGPSTTHGRRAPGVTALPDEAPPMREATPTADGERSLVRALGLKFGRIVIDAGHGGHDSGTLGPGGVQEKDIVLDVALRLGKLLRERLGAEVVYTRTDDTFVPLETRTAIANQAKADLFISIHANSSQDRTARGVETYYLNFTTSTDALEVAARENAVSDESIHELSDLVKQIALKDKIEESQEFAGDVQGSLYRGLEPGNPGLKDRGVKKAPFVVLIGANMPSILAEISFLTNPGDAHELRLPAYRQRIAESLYHGIEKYIGGLSGLHLAQNSAAPNAR